MRIKWQWFLGGRVMFWVMMISFVVLVFVFTIAYVVDPSTCVVMKVQNVDETSIKDLSEEYVESLGITIDKPIVYRFVRYRFDRGFRDKPGEEILLGTFHEWNGKYYIDISVDLYRLLTSLRCVVIHETRHMIVEYLKDEKIINLEKYTEEIANEEDIYYNDLFNSGIYLLKKSQNKN